MSKSDILDFMEKIMSLKVVQDISFAAGPDVLQRKPQPFT